MGLNQQRWPQVRVAVSKPLNKDFTHGRSCFSWLYSSKTFKVPTCRSSETATANSNVYTCKSEVTGVHPYLCGRGHYFFSVHAARLMVPQGRGLIVMISSMGGLQYLFNVAYGVGKAAVGSSSFYVYPAPVKTCTLRLNNCGLLPVRQACSRHGR